MTAATLRMDFEATAIRTRWTMSMSIVAHALLFLFLSLHHIVAPELAPITEITLIEPGDLAPAAGSARPAASGSPVTGVTAKAMTDMHFKRIVAKGEMVPDPQSSWDFEDRLDARLAAMQQKAAQATAGTSPSKVPASLFGSSPAMMAGGTGIGTPISLNRGGGGGGPPLPLVRGGGSGSAPALATVSEPRQRSENPAPARSSETTARRTVAGASITGPIADRPILSYSVPAYPEWAKHDAVEGAVTLYFVVRADGGVKENILVQRTAGFEDFDENARVALRAWRFKALRPGQAGEQWGTITFHFRLRDAG
ncbi:MAG TPA: energy transducer TonB [Candidatus Eisenbacteria bacterium]|jgi:TonB family protein